MQSSHWQQSCSTHERTSRRTIWEESATTASSTTRMLMLTSRRSFSSTDRAKTETVDSHTQFSALLMKTSKILLQHGFSTSVTSSRRNSIQTRQRLLPTRKVSMKVVCRRTNCVAWCSRSKSQTLTRTNSFRRCGMPTAQKGKHGGSSHRTGSSTRWSRWNLGKVYSRLTPNFT